jgi:hypothetical protein
MMPTTTTEEKYPMHAKLKGLNGSNQIVGDFIEWLDEQRIEMAQWHDAVDGQEDAFLVPIHKSRDDLLAEFFDIDRDVLENEKRAILDEFRAQQSDD